MPIYEYACDGCGDEFELEQRITAEPIKSCPQCRSRKVRRLISRTSFVLRGSGWYADLYSSNRSGDNKANGKGEDTAPAGDSKAAAESAGSKPQSKGKDGEANKGKSAKAAA